ncbi:ATP-binding protein [Streptomyces asiaticus]
MPSDLADDALLVVSELITNAVVHALPPASLCLSRQGGRAACAVRIEVTDAGPALPPHHGRSPRLPEETGPHPLAHGVALPLAIDDDRVVVEIARLPCLDRQP